MQLKTLNPKRLDQNTRNAHVGWQEFGICGIRHTGLDMSSASYSHREDETIQSSPQGKWIMNPSCAPEAVVKLPAQTVQMLARSGV